MYFEGSKRTRVQKGNDTPQEYKREMIPPRVHKENIPLNSTKGKWYPSRVQKGNDTPQEYTKKWYPSRVHKEMIPL